MNLSEKIKKRRKELGLTQTELANLVGTTQQNIGKIEKGENQNTALIVPISIALKCDPKWLEMGIGDYPEDKQKNKESFYVEHLDIIASAGFGYLNSDVQEVIKLIEFDRDQAKLLFNGLMSDNLKVININGDSMQGTFDSGDALYIDVSIRFFEGDGIYVFTFGRNLYIKRLQVIKDIIRVKSDNALYDPWEIHEYELDQLYIHGKVMLSQSMLLRKHG